MIKFINILILFISNCYHFHYPSILTGKNSVYVNIILMDNGRIWISEILDGYDNKNTFTESILYPSKF
jgi:hypothetical protein